MTQRFCCLNFFFAKKCPQSIFSIRKNFLIFACFYRANYCLIKHLLLSMAFRIMWKSIEPLFQNVDQSTVWIMHTYALIWSLITGPRLCNTILCGSFVQTCPCRLYTCPQFLIYLFTRTVICGLWIICPHCNIMKKQWIIYCLWTELQIVDLFGHVLTPKCLVHII